MDLKAEWGLLLKKHGWLGDAQVRYRRMLESRSAGEDSGELLRFAAEMDRAGFGPLDLAIQIYLDRFPYAPMLTTIDGIDHVLPSISAARAHSQGLAAAMDGLEYARRKALADPVCGGVPAPFWGRRRILPSHLSARGALATSERLLMLVRSDGRQMFQCANGRWHPMPGDGEIAMECGWGMMAYYDARSAHEAARRIRWRIPHGWEWLAIFGALFSHAFADAASKLLGTLFGLFS